MEIAPAIAHSETSPVKKFAPLKQRPDLFPNVGLLGSRMIPKRKGKNPAFGTSRMNTASGVATRTIYAVTPVRIYEMFQGPETSNNVKLPVIKRQLLGRTAMKLGRRNCLTA